MKKQKIHTPSYSFHGGFPVNISMIVQPKLQISTARARSELVSFCITACMSCRKEVMSELSMSKSKESNKDIIEQADTSGAIQYGLPFRERFDTCPVSYIISKSKLVKLNIIKVMNSRTWNMIGNCTGHIDDRNDV